jgi:hypothetical protein
MRFLKKALFQVLWCLGFVAVIAGCEQASEQVVRIPDVLIECSESTSDFCFSGGACGGSAPQVLVQMSRSGCGESVNFDPVATGSTSLQCDSSGCSGRVSNWIDPETMDTRNEVITGRMDICALLSCNVVGSPQPGNLINYFDTNIQSSQSILVRDSNWREF